MSIARNLEVLRRRIAESARRAGRDPGEVTLVAVSKRHSVEAIREAYESGQRVFGENYVQELLEKREALGDLPDIEWHFIGHLQKNKVRKLVGRVSLIETVDSIEHMREVSKRATSQGVTADVLVQVKIGDEPTKSGCSPEALAEVLEAGRGLPGLRVRGLMTIPPFEEDLDRAREHFRALRRLRDQQQRADELEVLSMGMSHDFEVAIEEGATLVRVGTAIFGPRPG